MADVIPTLLLLALPASGKSELRRYLASLPDDRAATDFRLGRTLQLDDYPYVHMMRRISAELADLGENPAFFESDETPFINGAEWGTLIHLINVDYAGFDQPDPEPQSAAQWLLDHIDTARHEVGLPETLADVSLSGRQALLARIEAEARALWEDRHATISADRSGATTVIEFARGGPKGAPLPLQPPNGYGYSLAELSAEILVEASILYVWVTPEESRRRNVARARPGRDGDASILHHGVPEVVMRGDYGTDDMMWLIEHSDRPGTVRVETDTAVYHLPVAVFDNRSDKTSFLRDDPQEWPEASVAMLHRELAAALAALPS